MPSGFAHIAAGIPSDTGYIYILTAVEPGGIAGLQADITQPQALYPSFNGCDSIAVAIAMPGNTPV